MIKEEKYFTADMIKQMAMKLGYMRNVNDTLDYEVMPEGPESNVVIRFEWNDDESLLSL